jgi:5'-nucleotidase
MIRTNRFSVALLLSLGLAIASLGCDSSSDEGSGGSGGTSGGPLRILITNDDGVKAAGIDAVVEALKDDPNNEIIVSAPAENQSGRGDTTTPTPPPLEAMMTTTASGYPATAVMGFPADSVIYGLANLYPDEPPHVVLSGLNDGQNVGDWNGGLLSQISGTVGAAKTAACLGVPALASSQGEGDTVDFPSGVIEVVAWLEANRGALLAGEVSLENITSINIPSCDTGSIRGREEVPLGTEKPDDLSLNGPQDCESTLENPTDDIQAFFNGYVSVTLVPSNSSMTCDDLN